GFGNDVPLTILIEKVGDRHAFSGWRRGRLARGPPGDAPADELRLPDLLRLLLGRDRLRRAPGQGKCVDGHAVAPPLVHHIEPPRVVAARTGLAPFRLALLADCHRRTLLQ